MERKIKDIIMNFCGEKVISINRMSGGISFCTYKIETENDKAYVFRYGENYVNSGGRYIDIGKTFKREKYFFDTIASKMAIKVPHIYYVDDSLEEFEYIYEIYDYIEGCSLEEISDKKIEEEIYYQIGKIIARINKIKLDDDKFIEEKWETFFSRRLKERLIPLKKENLINDDEIQTICSFFEKYNYTGDRAFLHLDVRKGNIIYNNGMIGLIDAENAEFGDPLFELARIDVYGEMNTFFYRGYMDEMGIERIERETVLYHGYKFEALAFLANVFINEIEVEEETVRNMKNDIIQLKEKILNYI